MESDLKKLEKELLEGSISAPHELGKIGSPEAITILLNALQYSRDTTRRAIIQGLPIVPRIEPELINILRSTHEYKGIWDGMIHVDTVIKLSALKTSTAIEAIRQWTSDTLSWQDDERSYAFEGLLSLSRINDIESLPLFRQCLHDSDPNIRSASVFAIGQMRDTSSVPDLIQLLSDKTEDPLESEALICDTAAEALGRIGDERAIQPLAIMIINGETGMHALKAIQALGTLSERGFDALLSIMPRVSIELKRDIIYSFGLIGNKHAVEVLVETLKSDDELSRGNAIESLGNLRDDRTLDSLINALSDNSSIVRHQAVYSLSKFRDPRVIQPLILLLADTEQDDWHNRVCDAAAEALEKIGTREAITAVEKWKQTNSSSTSS